MVPVSKQLIHNEEPDLEFYDGTYLPDGRIIANSNISVIKACLV